MPKPVIMFVSQWKLTNKNHENLLLQEQKIEVLPHFDTACETEYCLGCKCGTLTPAEIRSLATCSQQLKNQFAMALPCGQRETV